MEHGGSQRKNIYSSILHPHLCRSSVQDDLLGYCNIQHCTSDIDHLLHLFYLPAHDIQFRQDHSKRSLRRSCEFRAIHRNHHIDIRRHGRGTADANALGAPNADEEEDWPQRCFRNGSHVSVTPHQQNN
jgi:hypothetical protein